MNIGEHILKIIGWTEKAETRLTSIEASLSKEKDELTAEVNELRTENAQLHNDLATARQSIKSLSDEKATMIADHKAAIDAKEADVERRASLKAGEIVAAQSVPPVSNQPKANAHSTKKDISGLKGLDRVRAAIR